MESMTSISELDVAASGFAPQASNEYSFRWGKQFRFLTLRTLNSKVVIRNNSILIEINKYYFGFIKGNKSTIQLPIREISNLETKYTLSICDLVVAGVYALGGIINPLFFLIVPLCVWACFNSNLIITTISDDDIRIPSFSKKDAKRFINYYNEIFADL